LPEEARRLDTHVTAHSAETPRKECTFIFISINGSEVSKNRYEWGEEECIYDFGGKVRSK
jgi:hypothetical protein